MSSTVRAVRRALVSVSDKSNLSTLAEVFKARGIEVLSTGGTAKALADLGVSVVKVSEYTGAPEILGGRVKTLHPKIHGGILALPTSEHEAEAAEHGIPPIDLVVVNLYPFRETIAREGTTFAEAIENIDIGGPTMVRAAAKNWNRVAVVVDHVQRHLDDELDAGALAELSGFSRHHFHRVFRGATGESVMGFCRRLRLERAAQQLRYGDASVTEIAFDVGYGSHEAFTRAFRARFGVPPRTFRATTEPRTMPDVPVTLRHEPARVALALRHVGPYEDCDAATWFGDCLSSAGGSASLVRPAVRQMLFVLRPWQEQVRPMPAPMLRQTLRCDHQAVHKLSDGQGT